MNRPTSWFRKVYFKDKYRCVYCGKNMLKELDLWLSLEIDHIIPKKRGGTDNPFNLVTSCNVCNKSKSSYYSKQLNANIDDLKLIDKRENILDDIRNYILLKRKNEQIRWIKAQNEFDNILNEEMRES